MKNKALVVIDLQNDITKNYKMIIGQVNEAFAGFIEKNDIIMPIRAAM